MADLARPGAAGPAKGKRPINLGVIMGAQGPHGGYVVVQVDKNSSGGKAGVAIGDEIVTWNGQKPPGEKEFFALLESVGVGGTMKLHLYRKGQPLDLAM